MTTQELYKKATTLPKLPGIYIIRNAKNTIIYIGKSKVLRTRVSQYFRPGVPHDQKVSRMIAAAADFDIIVTDSEFEALVLECSQIKIHRPKYNILLKDDKGYRYIRISPGEWPHITAEKQKPENASGEWLGPYISGHGVNNLISAALDAFLLPHCSRKFPQDFGKQRPCLYAHIGKCMAVCTGKIPHALYLETLENALSMIRGGGGSMLHMLAQRMEEAAENLEFERAALLRDQIAAIKKLGDSQKVIRSDEKDLDVIAFAQGAGSACVAVLRFRGGVLFDKREFLFYNEGSTHALREEFVPSYYLGEDEDIPKVVAVDKRLPDHELLQRLLCEKKGSKVQLYVPERGDTKKLVETAYTNAVDRLARESGRVRKEDKALNELAGLLGLSAPPHVIESYDISNWGDGTSVCGMVVFEDGKPKKAGYRRFKIKSVSGTDDYASMSEALLRRASEYDSGAKGQFGELPHLILLDGGIGQVHAGVAALANTGLSSVPIFGMVKDAHHRTRGIISPDGGEIQLSLHRNSFTLITAIQDETHRFAINYQRSSQKKRTFSSVLTTLPGIGPATAKALMGHFKTLKAIATAGEEELCAVKGVSKSAARTVYLHFHPEKNG